MLAQRADEVFRNRIALVDVSADVADPSLDFFLRSGLDVVLVVAVRHGLDVVQDRALGDLADEQPVGIHVDGLQDLQGHVGVRVSVEIGEAVAGLAIVIKVCKLIYISSALESKVLENLERSFLVQDADVHLSGILDHAGRVVAFIDTDCDLIVAADLCVHHEKCWAGRSTHWNQDCREKYQ